LNSVDALVRQDDPPQRHRPYFRWSRAVEGKTSGRRLHERQAGPDRHLDRELATSGADRRTVGGSVAGGRRDPVPLSTTAKQLRERRVGRKWSTRKANVRIVGEDVQSAGVEIDQQLG
jgi:hypothetical protein